jgi:hypothetical protein
MVEVLQMQSTAMHLVPNFMNEYSERVCVLLGAEKLLRLQNFMSAFPQPNDIALA